MRYLAGAAGPISKEDQAAIDDLIAQAAKVKKLTSADAGRILLMVPPGYWLDLRSHDELAIAKTLKMRLFIAQGGRDYQVTTTDFDAWKVGLSGRDNVTFQLYPSLNHLFITGEGKSLPGEYDKPGNVDAAVITDLSDWLLK